MATHGKAREITATALEQCEPFRRSGYSMSAHSGPQDGHGQMPADAAALYEADRPHIAYTVVSYHTPIAWVLNDGQVRVPDVRYSATTTQHQSMCRVHLNRARVVRADY